MYKNSFFMSFSGTILRPIRRQFTFTSDTGLGVGMGIGKYLGENNSIELQVDHDLYLSGTLKYRLEYFPKRPRMSLGIVLGYKRELVALSRLDQFIANNEVLAKGYLIYGLTIQLPMVYNGFRLEFLYWNADKDLLVARFGFVFLF